MKKEQKARFSKALGLYLMKVRREQKMTVAELAEKSNLSEPHIWKIETGKVDMKISSYKSIKDALGLSGQDLL